MIDEMMGFKSFKSARLRNAKHEILLGSIMFHVRRRPADGGLRKRKKKPGSLGAATSNNRDPRSVDSGPVLVELGPDGSTPHLGDSARTLRLTNDVMEVGSANGIALQLYGPHIQPRHAVISNTDGLTSITPCHADAHTYVNGQRIHQTTILSHGNYVKFGHSNSYRFLDLSQEGRPRHPSIVDSTSMYDRSPRALSPSDHPRENFETTFDLEGNVETVSTASGAREDNRSLGSSSENRIAGIDRYPRGQDPILPAVLEFPEDPQEQFLARVITHLDVTTPTFRLAPAYTLYLCARYRASTHYRPELTPTERAHKLTLLLQHAAKLVRHTVQDRSTESTSQAFWLANASELLHFLKSDRHVSAFSVQAQEILADAVQLAFRNLVACLTDELNSAMNNLTSESGDDHPRDIINTLSNAMNLLRKCRVNAALTIQLFSQLFHWISARSLSAIINSPGLCNRIFGMKLFNRLRNLQAWAESQGLELAAECHLSKIVQCAHLLQASKQTPEELANLSAACFKLNSLQLRALLTQYKGEHGEQVAPATLLEQAARAAEGVADELARAEGREVRLHEDPAPPLQLLLPDDGFSCDVVQGVPAGLADFLQPLQASGLCRLAAQPTSSGHWTVYMNAPRPPSALSTTQPEIQIIRLHKAGGGMGLSIVAAKGAGQERLGIYIKSVVPGGAADRDGRLTAGDQLLSVDGQSLLGITQEKAAEFLVRTGSIVTLEVAKGGAVYHGLATLLQQPSPTPHRESTSKNATVKNSNHLVKQQHIDDDVFDVSLEVKQAPKCKNYDLKQGKSISLDASETIDCNSFNSSESLLNVGTKRSNHLSNSLQELSSSTSSLNSGIHESTLDLTLIDPNTSMKHWKSPDDLRDGQVKTLPQRFEHVLKFKHPKIGSASVPDLKTCLVADVKQKSLSDEHLEVNSKLTEYERMEVLKVLCDWSLQGCEANNDANFSLKIIKEFRNLEEKSNLSKCYVKFKSEPNLSPKIPINMPNETKVFKSTSVDNLGSNDVNGDFLHDCEFINCIFNRNFNPALGTKSNFRLNNNVVESKQLKGILKNNNEYIQDVNFVNNSEKTEKKQISLQNMGRSCSEATLLKSFNSQLTRRRSLEHLTQTNSNIKKFPESYIVTKRTFKNNASQETGFESKDLPKTWKSCSDLKNQQRVIKKCCRNAKRTCPLLNDCRHEKRNTKSCTEIDRQHLEFIARVAALKDIQLSNLNCPRRMSERDLPSRVDSERTIPSSKSVPALHHISPNSEQPRSTGTHDMFNPGYSRTSSNNSINTNSAPTVPQNGIVNNQTNLRSRSTHNLHQQDSAFYQNLSVFRNKMPSPHQLGERTSALRSSQNSLQSTIANPQRPTSAYYPHNAYPMSSKGANLNQSIPNLKSPPSVHRLQNEDVRSGPFPLVNQQNSQSQQYINHNPNYGGQGQTYPGPNQIFSGQNQSYPSPNYPRAHEDINHKHSPYTPQSRNELNNSYPQNYPMNMQHLNSSRQDDIKPPDPRYAAGLLREDVLRQSHMNRNDETMRYPTTSNVRIQEAQIQSSRLPDNEIRTSRSEDMLRQHTLTQNEMSRYASSGNIRAQGELTQARPDHFPQRLTNDDRKDLRGQTKLAEIGEEVRRRQNRVLSPQQHSPGYYPQHYPQQNYHAQVAQNTQHLHNLNLNQYPQSGGYPQHPTQPSNYVQYNSQPNSPTSPNYPKSPPLAPKPLRKQEDPPELPPTNTHPLYSASLQDPPKMAFYSNSNVSNNKGPARDPWAREEQERQAEVRREQARQWQEQQIRELLSLSYRTSQQEEQLRVLQLEREFQRRALEAAEQDDEDTEEKESPSCTPYTPPTATANMTPTTPKQEIPASILKPGVISNTPVQLPEPEAPPPPERGSSYVVMSIHNKEGTKRVTFNDTPPISPPSNLSIEETAREDPNSFIRQAESMLASPTTPTDGTLGIATATPGVIGAQEVYRDPRTRRLAEQAQQKMQTTVPEKLSFKEKMKMFAMETGESGTPKDKSKISRAQRDIDNLGTPPSSNLVH
ncbi:hypothetical protein FQA39_LY14543 [Lamprigera yunnana]|nr:hypothetical protein FQA39_LY14543 [Lamprigera yunnana]